MNQRRSGWRAGLAAALGCLAAATCGGTVSTPGSGGAPATSSSSSGGDTGGAPSTSTASSGGAPSTSSSSSGGDTGGAPATSSSSSGGGTGGAGGTLDCIGPMPGGGQVVWSTALPIPASLPAYAYDTWWVESVAVGATGNPLVALQYHTPGIDIDTPTGVVLQRFDSAGTSLGNVGPAPSSGWAPPLSTLEAFAGDHFVLTARIVQSVQETQLIRTDAFIASSVLPSPSGANALVSATGDDAGHVFAAYWTNGSVTFPLGGSQSTPYIVKADKTKATLWTKPILGDAYLRADGGGGLYVTGSGPPSSADPGCGVLDPWQGYVARFDGAGSCLWRRTIDFESGAIMSYDIEAGGPDAAYLGGVFHGTIDLGCGPLTPDANGGTYVARLDAHGQCLWNRRLPSYDVHPYLVLPDGGLLVWAEFQGTVDLGCGPLTSAGTQDTAIARFSPAGACTLNRDLGAPGASVRCDRPAADAAGRTKLRCTITGTADLGGGPVTSAAGEHVLVALDETGAFAWQKAPFDGRFALDPCGAVIAAEACGTCGPNAAAGITVAKLAP
ncbi:MAG: hypothetical protein QM820_43560 [Minicystis sp.]